MNRLSKILVVSLILVVASLFVLQYKFKAEITKAINDKLPSKIKFDYAQIYANVFSGNVVLDSVSAELLNSDKNTITSINTKSLKVKGINLWHFIFNKTISIDNIIFENPDLQYYQNQQEKARPKVSTTNKQFEKDIHIDKISFVNGSFRGNTKGDSLFVSVDSIHFELKGISTNAYRLKQKIPFEKINLLASTFSFFIL